MSETLPRAEEASYADEVTGVEPLIVGNKFRMARQLCVHDDEVVYDAIHTGTERRVRLHMLARNESSKSPLVERMRRAARAAGRVPHPHVLGVVDSGTDPSGKPFLVYEYFGSTSLSDWIAQAGPQPVDVAARVICQVLEALTALHRGGVVHRSIRPENVLIEWNGAELRTKLTGFGWAVVQGKFDDAPALSRAFSRYMAPEARRDPHASGPALDLFAVGAMMRFVLTGDPAQPFADGPIERAIARACAEEPTERFVGAEQFFATVAALMPEAGDSESGPGVDQLQQDIRHLQERREHGDGLAMQAADDSRMELYPVLMMIEAIYARVRAAGWKLLCDELPEIEDLLPGAGNGTHYRSEGVSAQLVSKLLHTADRLGGQGNLTWLTEIGEALVKRGLTRFCPQLPAQLTSEALVDCMPELWSHMARHGEVRIVERTVNGARIAIRGQITPTLEVCAVVAGMLRAQLRLLSERGEVSVIASQALGDSADIFVLSWSRARNPA